MIKKLSVTTESDLFNGLNEQECMDVISKIEEILTKMPKAQRSLRPPSHPNSLSIRTINKTRDYLGDAILAIRNAYNVSNSIPSTEDDGGFLTND